MSESDYRDRRSRIASRAEKAPAEARIVSTSSDYPRPKPRLQYPHYATIYQHEGVYTDATRHDTMRRIYLWNTPAHKRAAKPKDDPALVRNFETKFRSVLKERKDHEWSRKYYYPSDDYRGRKERRDDTELESPRSTYSEDRRSSSRTRYLQDDDNHGDTSYRSTYSSASSVSSSSSRRYEVDSERRRDRSDERTSSRRLQTTSDRDPPTSKARDNPRSLESTSSRRRLERYLTQSESKVNQRDGRARRSSEETPIGSSDLVQHVERLQIDVETDGDLEIEEPKKFYVPDEDDNPVKKSSSSSSSSSSSDNEAE